jgi:hypothetical protein
MLAEPSRIGELYRWLGVSGDVRPDEAGPVNASSAVGDELDDDLVTRLRDYYADSDAALAQLLGRDLPWTDRWYP